MEAVLTRTVKVQKNTNAYWDNLNPVLSPNEGAFSNDTSILKIGDGVTPWRDLEPSNVFPSFGPGDGAEYLPLTGGTVTGALNVIGNVTANNVTTTTSNSTNSTVTGTVTAQNATITNGTVTNLTTSSLNLSGWTVTIS